ncbi:MAG TPA: L,D-transpeptidase family protein [Aggregatilineaceae bacterium]|nr:L,D-transpeptidase family protein [Aggregatilineaceae bacterium]
MRYRLYFSVFLFFLLLTLAACGGTESDDKTLPPTLSLDQLVTQNALTAQSQLPTSAIEPTVAAALASPTTAATEAAATSTAPAELSEAQIEATGIMQTYTAEAQTGTAVAQAVDLTATGDALVIPFTQTYAAIQQGIQTAQANASLTPAVMTLTPSPESPDFVPTASGEEESYQVVFYGNRYNNDDIFLMTLDGQTRLLTGSPANEREPSCSPDASAVVYASDATGSYQLYLQRLDLNEPVQLTDSEGMNFAPIFSIDGSQIAFVSTRNQGIPTIWIMDADGANQRQLTTELGRDTSPSWGPDGRQILFSSEQTGDWDVFLTILDEIEGEFPLLPTEFSADNQIWPFFDPTGERIVYTVQRDLEDPQTADIYLLDFELEEPAPLLASAVAEIAWAFASDNQLLASVGGPGDVQIALVNTDTGETVMLTDAGTFNGGARMCVVPLSHLAPEPTPAPSPTPSPPPTDTPNPTDTPQPTDTPAVTPTLGTPTVTPTTETSSLMLATYAMPPELAAVQGRQHIVQRGENLSAIASRYGISMDTLIDINGLADPNRLSVGQHLTIPVTHIAYRQGGYQSPDSDLTGINLVRKQIVVHLKSQRVYAYENGRIVRNVLVSTGLDPNPTVKGEFQIYQKLPSQTMSGPGYYLPGVPFVMYFYQGYGLHGTYWHDNFGQPMSHGCVNLPTPEAKWFYDWAEIGTPVIVEE